MKNDINIIIKNLIWFILSGLTCAFVLGTIFIDMHLFKGVPESRVVECSQEAMLLVSSFIFFYLAWKKQKGGLWLVGGFFACMAIRELDVVFDEIFHGAWFYFAVITAVVCVYKAWKAGVEHSVHTLAEFAQSKVFPKVSCGLLIVLVYSRIIGYKPLWQLVMQKHYLRNVKTIVEEGAELFGYSIIFLAAIEYAHYLLSQKEN